MDDAMNAVTNISKPNSSLCAGPWFAENIYLWHTVPLFAHISVSNHFLSVFLAAQSIVTVQRQWQNFVENSGTLVYSIGAAWCTVQVTFEKLWNSVHKTVFFHRECFLSITYSSANFLEPSPLEIQEEDGRSRGHTVYETEETVQKPLTAVVQKRFMFVSEIWERASGITVKTFQESGNKTNDYMPSMPVLRKTAPFGFFED